MEKRMAEADIGLIGLGTMGAMMAMNIADNGFQVAVHNRTTSRIGAFIDEAGDLADRLQPCESLEALVRWESPTRGFVGPDLFIPFAEETGLVNELGRQILGAFLMGVGGVTAMGCSVGQGLTAFSLLHWGAPVTLAAIAAGGALGLRQLIRGFHAL